MEQKKKKTYGDKKENEDNRESFRNKQRKSAGKTSKFNENS